MEERKKWVLRGSASWHMSKREEWEDSFNQEGGKNFDGRTLESLFPIHLGVWSGQIMLESI